MVSNQNSYFAMACCAFHAKSAMVSYLNHTPCYQHDYKATKAMDILFYTYSL